VVTLVSDTGSGQMAVHRPLATYRNTPIGRIDEE
jgi:hypothetical protein